MDYHSNNGLFVRRSFVRQRNPAVRWVRDWIPQEVAGTGKRVYLLKWVREDMLKVLKEKFKEPEPEEPKPEPTTEILFLCSYEGCNKAFPNESQYRKHAHIHGERQYACSFPGCGKKFLDSSKLKRHQVVHTGEKNFICPHEGCGKAFNLDFNLRAHMKIHSQEHYHVCPYADCGKRYTQECKLKSHIKMHHEKNPAVEVMKHTPPAEKPHNIVKASPSVVYSSPSSDRPYVCPYEGCGKNYIHEYKLNLHLKNQHPGHNTVEEASDQDVYIAKGGVAKSSKRNKPSLQHKMPPAKLAYQKSSPLASASVSVSKQQQWPPSRDIYEEDSEETEEENENVAGESWRYREVNGDDEETEDED
ncbi:uncharacterized protein A4U43_C09F7210 [Asparagus officinalis]|uniref:C2H2-type domain-containing protein n=1 Tax=Asparagus officinalis TaxID=4686 RepID=A0A5P1E6D4_ASPOF|nr:uncharacterized zinc finger protein At4g06634-like [Asparagus officinalis]ONK58029.1 uncharacterized protein A4U43_C09F7210 [Asparagus officinalis]